MDVCQCWCLCGSRPFSRTVLLHYSDTMIRVLITGGTFDKQYDAVKGELTFRDTHLPEILRTVGCDLPIHLEIQSLVDSLEMDESQREAIVASCRDAEESRIVITHGTDTMEQTARLLDAAGIGATKTIVLTGAMVPFTIAGSDAVFNFGGALIAVQTLPPGVFVVMHGRVFPAGSVSKDRSRGRFVEGRGPAA
jgi:L-asparaginase